jgi:hypothetical protein
LKIEIQPLEDRWIAAAVAFNRRLDQAHTAHTIRLPESPEPEMLLRGEAPFWQECFLAVEGSAVRGGYIMYHQQWNIGGGIFSTVNPTKPISEGVINGAYGLVGVKLVQDAARREKLMFGLGLGDGQATKLLKATGWDIWPVPLYFKILNGTAFLKQFTALRSRYPKLADAAAACGLGSAGVKLASAVFERGANSRGYFAEPVDHFSEWADDVWESAHREYSALAVRDRPAMNALFAGRSDMTCLRVWKGGTVGWAVVYRPKDRLGKFGSMEVMSILDCLAKPEHADGVIWTATEFLRTQGADVVLSNQSHPAWKTAMRRGGFFPGPTTYLFASAPALTEILQRTDPGRTGMHFNRGGGDIPLEWRLSERTHRPQARADLVELQET